MTKYGYIYCTTNLANGKMYIGQKKGEFNPYYYGSGLYITRAIKKYGRELFSVELIVEVETEVELHETEIRMISEYKIYYGSGMLYNISSGGESGFRGGHHSARSKMILSSKNKGRILGPMPESRKILLSSILKGRSPKPSALQALREKAKLRIGKKRAVVTKEKIRQAIIEHWKTRDHTISESRKKAIGDFHRGRKRAESTRAKMRKQKSLETIQHMRNAWKIRKEQRDLVGLNA